MALVKSDEKKKEAGAEAPDISELSRDLGILFLLQ
jgi:hypothetical protein